MVGAPRIVSIHKILSQLYSELRYPYGEDEVQGEGGHGHQSKHGTELFIQNPANLTKFKPQDRIMFKMR